MWATRTPNSNEPGSSKAMEALEGFHGGPGRQGFLDVKDYFNNENSWLKTGLVGFNSLVKWRDWCKHILKIDKSGQLFGDAWGQIFAMWQSLFDTVLPMPTVALLLQDKTFLAGGFASVIAVTIALFDSAAKDLMKLQRVIGSVWAAREQSRKDQTCAKTRTPSCLVSTTRSISFVKCFIIA